MKLKKKIYFKSKSINYCAIIFLKYILYTHLCVCVYVYLGPSGSGVAPLSADGPGLDTDALFTWPLPPAPVDPPRVNSDTVEVKLFSFIFIIHTLYIYISYVHLWIIKNFKSEGILFINNIVDSITNKIEKKKK